MVDASARGFKGQGRQSLRREKSHGCGIVSGLKTAPYQRAPVDDDDIRTPGVLAPCNDVDEPLHFGLQAGLLPALANSSLLGGFTVIDKTRRQAPEPLLGFPSPADEEQAVALIGHEQGRSHFMLTKDNAVAPWTVPTVLSKGVAFLKRGPALRAAIQCRT